MTVWAHAIRGVAFDMDGLIVNTEDLYTEVASILLGRRQRAFTSQLKSQMMGLPGPQAFAVMIQEHGLEDSPQQLAEESDAIFVDLLPAKLRTLPGLEQLLEHIDDRRLPRCIATSSTRHFAERVLQIVGMPGRFDFIVTAADVPRGKPAPDIYVEAARRMGIAPWQMLVLEDSHHGSRAGLSAGACTIAVPGAHSSDHDFSGVLFQARGLSDPQILQLLR